MDCSFDHDSLGFNFCPQCGEEVKLSAKAPQTLSQPIASTLTANSGHESTNSNYEQRSNQSTNGFAIAGFITSLLVCWPVGLILSSVALSQFKKDPNQKGRGLAIAGLVIGLLTTLIVIFTIIVIGASSKN